MSAYDVTCDKLTLICQEMLTFLEESGVPKESIVKIQESIPKIEPLNNVKPGMSVSFNRSVMDALVTIQSYSTCYPYMKVPCLVSKLFQAWELLSDINSTAQRLLTRKLNIMKTNRKANVEVMNMLEVLIQEYGECLKQSNMGYYKVRVMRNLYQQEETEQTSSSNNRSQ